MSAANKPPVKRPATGTLQLVRQPKLTGFLSSVRVAVGGDERGALGGGFPDGIIDLLTSKNRTLEIPLNAGTHEVHLHGGGMKRSVSVEIKPGEICRYLIFFSNMGAMGGGLTVVEDRIA